MAPRMKTRKDEAELEVQIASVDRKTKRIFWAPGTKNLSFSVDIEGPNGPEPKRDAQNMPVYNNGVPVYVSNTMKFRPVCEKPELFLSVFEWSEDMVNARYILARLEAMVADPGTNVMRDEEYQRSRNVEAYEARKAASAKDDEIGDLKSQLARARAEIASAGGKNDE